MPAPTDAPAPSENLSTEEAIASLLPPEPEEDGGDTPAEDPAPEPEAPDDGEGGEGDLEPPEDGGEDPEDTSQPALDPPPFWPDEAKADFANLTPTLQKRVRDFEDNRNKAVNESFQTFAAARKVADAEGAKLAQLAPLVAAAADQAQVMFDRPVEGLVDGAGNLLAPIKWRDIDWVAWHKTDPFGASAARSRFESEKTETERVIAANRIAQDQAHQQQFGSYVQEQGQALAALNPKLATDGQLRQAVGKHLIERGYSPDELRGIGARDMDVAYDAMRWRDLQAKTQQASRPGETPPRKAPQAKPLKSSAGAPPAPSRNRAAQEANAKFSKSGSTDDAVALLLARGSG